MADIPTQVLLSMLKQMCPWPGSSPLSSHHLAASSPNLLQLGLQGGLGWYHLWLISNGHSSMGPSEIWPSCKALVRTPEKTVRAKELRKEGVWLRWTSFQLQDLEGKAPVQKAKRTTSALETSLRLPSQK